MKKNIFLPGGSLDRAIPNYQYRPGQADMANHINTALKLKQNLIIEAPTGVGKSMAYLVPAIELAMESGRTIISTHTKVLQDQLVSKDIPALEFIMPGFLHSVLKGRANYLCPDRAMLLNDNLSMATISGWLDDSPSGELDRMKVRSHEWRIWNQVVSDQHACTACGQNCFFGQARIKAGKSQIVIVNHALLVSDLLYGGILPSCDLLVIDEAHHLEDVITDALSFSLSKSTFLSVVDEAVVALKQAGFSSELVGPLDKLNELAKRFFGYMTKVGLLSTKSKYFIELSNLWNDLSEPLLALSNMIDSAPKIFHLSEDLTRKLSILSVKITDIVGPMYNILFDPRNTISWVESAPSIHSAPLRIDRWVQANLLPTASTIVMTSATIQANGSFRYFAQNLGILDVRTEVVETPFNYKDNVSLILPTDTPSLKDKDLDRKLAEIIANLCRAAKGRTMILFTSYTQLNSVYTLVDAALFDTDITVISQSPDSNRSDMVSWFKSSQPAILLGVKSFWEGVDIPGSDLSQLIIVKLPFDVPTDPIIKGRSKLYKNPFRDFSLQRAIIAFRQGFGRLVRRDGDSGIVVVLDERLSSARYGAEFINALPDIDVIRCSSDDAAKIAASI